MATQCVSVICVGENNYVMKEVRLKRSNFVMSSVLVFDYFYFVFYLKLLTFG